MSLEVCAFNNRCPYSAPCPCDFLPSNSSGCSGLLEELQQPIRLGQLYTLGYTFSEESDLIFGGIASSVQTDINQWFIKLLIAIFIPTLFVFITLFIILIRSGLISFDTGYLLIGLTFFIVVLAIFWITWDTSYVVDRIDQTIRSKLTNNITENSAKLINILGCSYSTCLYDNSTKFPACNTTPVTNTHMDSLEIKVSSSIQDTNSLPFGTCRASSTPTPFETLCLFKGQVVPE